MSQEDTAPKKTILILGASYAGISTAHYLLKHIIPKLPSPSSYHITLVSPSTHTICRPACPRALISDSFFDQSKLFVSIPLQFNHYPSSTFQFIQANATSLDTENRTTQSFPFYALIIAIGSSTPSPLLSLNSSPHTSLQSTWTTFRAALPSARHIVIGGGGPVGIETAGELGEYLNGRPGGWFTSSRKPSVKITVLCSADKILPVLRPALAQKGEGMLSRVGVTVLKSVSVVSVTPEFAGRSPDSNGLTSKARIGLSNGEMIDADLYIPATGTVPNTAFLPKDLLVGDADLRVRTNPQTFRVEGTHERIYSIGDCSSAFRPAVHNILAGIPVLCKNIGKDLRAAAAEGKAGEGEADTQFKEDTREMQLVPIGRSAGVGAAMGWAVPGWMVWLIKGRDYWVWTTGRLWSGRQWG
ncbi:FAD/NAD(P)-binding domain-containing protein [Clohesyomyces aquaticus]|uniref:FAD/NAD(P)-binding domain-containing protein n=1 Tax=Clohesyomyces aquaticus TaxID=1231657 RepID=A0A1Y2A1W5_9PLEO|nr:FAD/NAD(P)-binding domain-containing protein [Clohesyomyces aquaticus]